MIYFTNTSLSQPHLMFIGRWTPFHRGHAAIINKKKKEHPDLPVLIQIRSTDSDDYPPRVRAELIKAWMLENKIAGTIMIIPNIYGIYYGRGVGYEIEQVKLPKDIEQVSATKIRIDIINHQPEAWTLDVASKSMAALLNHKVSTIIDHGYVIWLTGCPCAGKTTTANALQKLVQSAYPQLRIQPLDGDLMRNTPIAQSMGFSPEDRAVHIRRMGYMAKMFADHGILVIAAFISPSRKVRREISQIIGEERFIEVYIKASKQTRMKRDPKGLYAKAKAGKIRNLTGYNAAYEEPRSSLVCDTDELDANQAAKLIFSEVFADSS